MPAMPVGIALQSCAPVHPSAQRKRVGRWLDSLTVVAVVVLDVVDDDDVVIVVHVSFYIVCDHQRDF